MITWELVGAACVTAALLPVVVFFCVKFGRYAYLAGQKRFERDQQNERGV